jgi:hypothetical protein
MTRSKAAAVVASTALITHTGLPPANSAPLAKEANKKILPIGEAKSGEEGEALRYS